MLYFLWLGFRLLWLTWFNVFVVEQNMSEVHQDSGVVVKKSGSEAASKRPRNETSSTLPAFKVQLPQWNFFLKFFDKRGSVQLSFFFYHHIAIDENF